MKFTALFSGLAGTLAALSPLQASPPRPTIQVLSSTLTVDAAASGPVRQPSGDHQTQLSVDARSTGSGRVFAQEDATSDGAEAHALALAVGDAHPTFLSFGEITEASFFGNGGRGIAKASAFFEWDLRLRVPRDEGFQFQSEGKGRYLALSARLIDERTGNDAFAGIPPDEGVFGHLTVVPVPAGTYDFDLLGTQFAEGVLGGSRQGVDTNAAHFELSMDVVSGAPVAPVPEAPPLALAGGVALAGGFAAWRSRRQTATMVAE